MPPPSSWSRSRWRVEDSRVELRVTPDYTPLEPIIRRWIDEDVSRQPLFRRSRHAAVYRVEHEGLNYAVFLKLFFLRDAWDSLKRLVRPSRARRTLRANATLNRLGFYTEPIIGMAEYRRLGLTRKSLLITREIPDVHEARSVFRDPEYGLRADTARRRRMLKELGREIGAWHKAGLHHGDLRLSNVLMQRNGDACTFYWMDNERTRHYRCLTFRRRVHNLVQVIMDPGVFSRTDMLRLWRAYKDASGFAPLDEKAYLRKIIERTQARRRKRGWA